MKNQFIIPSIIIATSIIVGFYMVKPPSELKPPSEPQKVIVVQKPDISIHEAAKIGNIEAIKHHLATGTNVNVKINYATNVTKILLDEITGLEYPVTTNRLLFGVAPLHLAALFHRKEIAELLIAEGAAVNAMDDSGETPLNFAIETVATETADLLRKHGGKTGEELKAEGK